MDNGLGLYSGYTYKMLLGRCQNSTYNYKQSTKFLTLPASEGSLNLLGWVKVSPELLAGWDDE